MTLTPREQYDQDIAAIDSGIKSGELKAECAADLRNQAMLDMQRRKAEQRIKNDLEGAK